MAQTTTLLEIAEADQLGDRQAKRLQRRRRRRQGDRKGIVLRTVIAVVVCVDPDIPALLDGRRGVLAARRVCSAARCASGRSELTLDNFERVFASLPGADLVPATPWSSALFVTALTVIVNLLAGYAFARLRFRGRNVIFLLTLVDDDDPGPGDHGRAVQAGHRDSGIYGTYWAVILPGAAASAFGIFLARQFIIGIPDEI